MGWLLRASPGPGACWVTHSLVAVLNSGLWVMAGNHPQPNEKWSEGLVLLAQEQ